MPEEEAYASLAKLSEEITDSANLKTMLEIQEYIKQAKEKKEIINDMKKKNNSRAGSEKQYGPRLVGVILQDHWENSNEPFARAFREHTAEAEREADQLFVDIHPNTELCIDLKLMTRQPGRMPVGEYLPGMLTRDGEDHFLFIENGSKERVAPRRNPRIYRGRYINVLRHADGSLVLTFNRPTLNESFTFQDFCREAAEELLAVAGLIEE